MPELQVGLISDTHGLLRPQALEALAGSARIVHAGDIVDPAILDALSAIAPLTAVRGNNDRGAWAAALPDAALLEWGGWRVFVVHDRAHLPRHPQAAQCDVVVAGHSHQPLVAWRDGAPRATSTSAAPPGGCAPAWEPPGARPARRQLFVNPGSAGPRRFRLPVTVARLVLSDAGAEARIVHLL